MGVRVITVLEATSITQDNGFHINPKNFKDLLSCKNHSNTVSRTASFSSHIYFISFLEKLVVDQEQSFKIKDC